jgi:hypothetical protein
MSLQTRETVEKEITRFHIKTGLPVETLLKHAGISKRTWHEWALRRGIKTAHNNNIPKNYFITPQEEEAIIAYYLANPLKRYRMLSYEMVDLSIAFVSPSTVYNVIKRKNLDKKWAETAEMKRKGFNQPAGIHDQWHIAFSYVKIAGTFYYFLGLLDGYSQKMLAWKLCETMEGVNVEVLVMKAVDGVRAAQIIRTPRGPGSTDVVIASVIGLPNAELIESVKRNLHSHELMSFDVLVCAPETEDLVIEIEYNGKASEAEVKRIAEQYVYRLGIGGRFAERELYKLLEPLGLDTVEIISPGRDVQPSGRAVIVADIHAKRLGA